MILSKRARVALAAKTPTYDPTCITEDFIFPAHTVGRGSRVETLPQEIPAVLYTDEMCAELRRCATDPIYFMTKYVKIQHPTMGECPMSFNERPYLAKLVMHVQENKETIVKHPRQAGLSMTMSAYMLWMAMFQSNKSILAGAVKHAIAQDIRQRIRFMYDQLPTWMRAETKYNNKHIMEFDNGSRIYFDTVGERFARGHSYSFCYIDNFAYIRKEIQEYVLMCMIPCLVSAGTLVIASTPNTAGDQFYTHWQAAVTGDGFFSAFDIGYWDLPIAHANHAHHLQELLGRETFMREYGGEFTR